MKKINYQSIINIINKLAGIKIVELKIENEKMEFRYFNIKSNNMSDTKFLNKFLFDLYKQYKKFTTEQNLNFIKSYNKRFYYSFIKGQEYFNKQVEIL